MAATATHPAPAPEAPPARETRPDGTAATAAAAPPAGSTPPGGGGRRAIGSVLAAALHRYAGAWPVCVAMLSLCVPVPRGDVAASGRPTLPDLVSAALVLWCAVGLLRRRARPLTPLAALLLAGPVVAFAVATLASGDPGASLTGFVRYVQVFVAVPAAVLLTLRRSGDLRAACWALVALALFQGGVGVVQNLTGTGASYRGQDIRAVGTFGALDVMGMSTVVGCGLVAALALGTGAHPRGRRGVRLFALACAAALVVPLVCSYSRGAWIATAATATVVLLTAGPRRAVATLAAVGAVLVVVVGGLGVGSATVGERLTSITRVSDAPDQSVEDRYTLWDAALSMWRDAPLTGVGLKEFPAQRDGHAPLGLSSASDTAGAGAGFAREPLLSPHDIYLLVLSEQGLVGFVAVFGGWAALAVVGLRRLRSARRRGRDTDAGTAVLGVLLWQFLDFTSGDIGGPTTVLTSLCLGLAGWWALAAEDGGGHPAGPGRTA